MSEFIEFLSPQALAQLKEANTIVTELAKKIEAINSFKAPKTPSGGDAAVKKMTSEYERQAQTIARINELQKQSAQRLAQVGTESQGMFSKIGNGLKSVIQLFGVYSAAMMAHRAIVGTIGISSKLSDDLAQLSIYLKNSKEAADEVFESLKRIKTRTSLSDLLGLAEIVAKKGVAQNEIAGITAELDKLFLVLGEGLGNKEEATASIVKLISIFNTDGEITAGRIKDVGASLQYLTTSGVATGDYLIRFTERLGAVRSLTGQTMPEILGLGAGFEQLGIKAEVSANSTGQIIAKLLTDLPKYAKMANIPLEEFKSLMETNSTEGLIRFAEGIQKNSKSQEQFALKLKGAELQGVRVKSVLAEIAINGDLLRTKVEGATKAIKDVDNAFDSSSMKQKTFAATLDNIKKKFEEIISSKGVQDTFSNIAVAIYTLVAAIASIPFSAVLGGLSAWTTYKLLLNRTIIANSIAQVYNNLTTAKGILLRRITTASLAESTLAAQANIVTLTEQIAMQEAEIIATTEEIAANEALAVVLGQSIIERRALIATLETQVVAEEAVIAANKSLTASMSATGFGAIAVAIGLVVYGLYELLNAETAVEKNRRELKQLEQDQAEKLSRSNDATRKALDEKIALNEAANRRLVIDGKITNEKLLQNNKEYEIQAYKDLIADYNKRIEAAKKLQKDYENKLVFAAGPGKFNTKNRTDAQKAQDNYNKTQLALTKQKLQNDLKEAKKYQIELDKLLYKAIETPDGIDVKKGNGYKKQRIDLNFEEVESEHNLKLAILERKKAENSDTEEKSYKERLLMRLEYSHATIQIIDEQLKKELALNEFKKKEDLDKAEEAYKENKKNGYNDIKNTNEYNKAKADILKTFNNKNLIAAEKASQAINANQLSDLEFWKKIQYKKEDENLKLNKVINEGEIAKYKAIADNEKNTLLVREAAFQKYIQLEKDLLKAQMQSDLARAYTRGASQDELDAIVQGYQNAIDAIGRIKSPKILALEEIQKQMKGFVDSFTSKAGLSTVFNILQEGLDKYGDNWKAKTVVIMEAVQEMYNFISQASQANFDAEYERLEQQKNISLAFAGDSTAAREEIERQYEEKRKQIARREAKAKKQQAIMNIAIDTAQAIIGLWVNPGFPAAIPLSVAVGALGAAQIAMVSAQQIPEYWKGTDNAEGGLAWTQERGREIITDSQGRIKSTGSDKGAELTMLSKGDKVFTAEKSAMMFDNGLNSMLLKNGIVMPKVEVSMDAEKITNEIKSLANTISNNETIQVVSDGVDIIMKLKRKNEIVERTNKRIDFKGKSV
jgi:hypothetical protein